MASTRGTVDFLLDQMAAAGSVSARSMFGEYGLYCGGVLVGSICDDRLYIKPTAAGRAHAGAVAEVAPYPGAKPCLLIADDRWAAVHWLAELVRATAAALPAPTRTRRPRP